jgi:hypothetical protein
VVAVAGEDADGDGDAVGVNVPALRRDGREDELDRER